MCLFGGASFTDDVIFYDTSVNASLSLAPYFMVDGCAALMRRNLHLNPLLAVALLVAGSLLSSTSWKLEPITVLITSCAVIALGSVSSPVISKLGRIGGISYGVYL